MSKRNEFLTSSKRKNSESIMTLLTPAVHDFHGGFHNSPSSISHPLALFHNSGGTYEYEEVSEGSNIKQAKKKTRLTNHQVKYLERSFEVDTKLDLERKNQLAQDLGLQSRQVAIWFQNRRARSKSKQLERDYNNLKVLYDAAFSEKQKLEAQVLKLKEMLKMRGEESRKEDNEPSQVTSVDRVQVDINVNASTVISKTAVNPIESCMQEKIVQEAEFSCRTEQSELVNADSSNEEDEDIAHVLVKDTRNENMELIIRNAYPQGHISLHLETAPFINGFPPEYEEQALAMANFEWSYGLWQYDPSSLFV